MTERKRWKEIDTLYFIGIILVLIGHSHSSDWSKFDGTLLYYSVRFIYTFHMPLFFFISGFLFQNSSRLEIEGYWKWIKDKAIRLLTPYFFWSLIAAVPKQYIEEGKFSGTYIINTFINPRASVWGHFWFIPVLFVLYLIYGSVKKRTRKWLMLAISTVIYFLPIKTDIMGLADIKTAMVFFSIGQIVNYNIKVIKNFEERIRLGWKCVYCIATTSLVCVLTDLSYRVPAVGLLGAVLMISVCWIVSGMIYMGRWVANHNFTIYIFSCFFQSVVMMLCGNMHWIPMFVFMFSAGIIGPIIVVLIYEKCSFLHKPVIQLIFGVR